MTCYQMANYNDEERMAAALDEIDVDHLSEIVTELFVEIVEAERDG